MSYRKVTLLFSGINLATTELIWPLGGMIPGISGNGLWHINSLAVTFILVQVGSVIFGLSGLSTSFRRWSLGSAESNMRTWMATSAERISRRNREGRRLTRGDVEMLGGREPCMLHCFPVNASVDQTGGLSI